MLSIRTWATRAVVGAALLSFACVGAVFADETATPTVESLPGVEQISGDATEYLYHADWAEVRGQLTDSTVLRIVESEPLRRFFAALEAPAKREGVPGKLYDFMLTGLYARLVVVGTPADGEVRHYMLITPAAERRERLGRLVGELAPMPASAPVDDADAGEVPAGFRPFVTPQGSYLRWDDAGACWASDLAAAKLAAGAANDKSLGEAALFRETVGPLLAGRTKAPIAVYYHDVRPVWEGLDAAVPGGWSRMSWRAIDGLAGATFVEDGGFRNRHYWRLGATRSGLFAHTRETRLNWEWIRRVPAGASGFTTGVWDAPSFAATLACVMNWMMGGDAEAYAALPGQMAMTAPLADLLGPRYLVYRMPGEYGTFPLLGMTPNHNLVAVLESRDVAGLRAYLQQLCAVVPGSQTVRYAERDVLCVNLMYATVYCAFLDDAVLVTMHPQLLKDALENWAKPGAALMDTPAFATARRYLVEDACFLMYFPPGGFARGIYDEYIPQLQQMFALVGGYARMEGDGAPAAADQVFDAFALPRGRDVAAGVTRGTILSARDDGQGVLFDGWAPVLATPYWWTAVRAVGDFVPGGWRMETILGAVSWLAGEMP